MKINKLDVTAFAILYKLSVQAIQVIILRQQYRLNNAKFYARKFRFLFQEMKPQDYERQLLYNMVQISLMYPSLFLSQYKVKRNGYG